MPTAHDPMPSQQSPIVSIIVDASVLVAALVGDDDGPWALSVLASETLSAPYLMAVEATNVLRRSQLAGDLSSDVASMAHADMQTLAINWFPYLPFADRVWELRQNVTSNDAWYVALAEELGAPLATLDRKLERASGPTCSFLLPPT